MRPDDDRGRRRPPALRRRLPTHGQPHRQPQRLEPAPEPLPVLMCQQPRRRHKHRTAAARHHGQHRGQRHQRLAGAHIGLQQPAPVLRRRAAEPPADPRDRPALIACEHKPEPARERLGQARAARRQPCGRRRLRTMRSGFGPPPRRSPLQARDEGVGLGEREPVARRFLQRRVARKMQRLESRRQRPHPQRLTHAERNRVTEARRMLAQRRGNQPPQRPLAQPLSRRVDRHDPANVQRCLGRRLTLLRLHPLPFRVRHLPGLTALAQAPETDQLPRGREAGVHVRRVEPTQDDERRRFARHLEQRLDLEPVPRPAAPRRR